MSSLSHARRAAPSCQCLLWCVPSALGAALPAELPRAQDMAQLLRRLRWLATNAGLQGGALFDGEQLAGYACPIHRCGLMVLSP